MTVQVSDRPLFEELKPLFELMNWRELRKTADWLVPDASDTMILIRAGDIRMGIEQHM